MLFGRKGYQTLEELYLENEKLVYTFFHDYTEDPELIKDWSQELWFKVWNHFKIFRGKNKKMHRLICVSWLEIWLQTISGSRNRNGSVGEMWSGSPVTWLWKKSKNDRNSRSTTCRL